MRQAFADGIGWGDAKKRLFALINDEIGDARERYNNLLTRPQDIEQELLKGAEKARNLSQNMMDKVRQAVGIYGLT